MRSTSNSLTTYVCRIYKNGSVIANQMANSSGLNTRRNDMRTTVFFDTAAVGDYYEFYVQITGSTGTELEYPKWRGFKLSE